jgi:hypothetical protein
LCLSRDVEELTVVENSEGGDRLRLRQHHSVDPTKEDLVWSIRISSLNTWLVNIRARKALRGLEEKVWVNDGSFPCSVIYTD